jgi:hypothetical protein
MTGSLENKGRAAITMPEAADSSPANTPRSWRESNWLVIGELVVVALIFVADQRNLFLSARLRSCCLAGPRSGPAEWAGAGLGSRSIGAGRRRLRWVLPPESCSKGWSSSSPNLFWQSLRQAARPGAFSCFAWKSQVDPNRSRRDLDAGGLRRRNGLPWLFE